MDRGGYRRIRPGFMSRHSRRCYTCQGFGHYARDCPNRFTRTSQQSEVEILRAKLADREKEMNDLRNRRVEIKRTEQCGATKAEEDKEVQRESEEVETEEQLMNRLANQYKDDVVQESAKEASPAPKRRKAQRLYVSDSESDDLDDKFKELRNMMNSPVSDGGSLADRVKRRRRAATRNPTKEKKQSSTAVEGNQLRIGWSYMRPQLVQPGHVVRHPAVLWEFGQQPLSDE